MHCPSIYSYYILTSPILSLSQKSKKLVAFKEKSPPIMSPRELKAYEKHVQSTRERKQQREESNYDSPEGTLAARTPNTAKVSSAYTKHIARIRREKSDWAEPQLYLSTLLKLHTLICLGLNTKSYWTLLSLSLFAVVTFLVCTPTTSPLNFAQPTDSGTG